MAKQKQDDQQLCEDTGCSTENLPEVINDREKWRERVRNIPAISMTWWWWWWFLFSIHWSQFTSKTIFEYKYIYISNYICICVGMVDSGKSNKMIGISGKMDKSDTVKELWYYILYSKDFFFQCKMNLALFSVWFIHLSIGICTCVPYPWYGYAKLI